MEDAFALKWEPAVEQAALCVLEDAEDALDLAFVCFFLFLFRTATVKGTLSVAEGTALELVCCPNAAIMRAAVSPLPVAKDGSTVTNV